MEQQGAIDADPSGRRRAAALAGALALLAAAWLVATGWGPLEAGRWFGRWRTSQLGLGLVALWAAGLASAAGLGGRRTALRLTLLHAGVVASWGLLELAGALGLVSWGRLLGTRPGPPLGSLAVPHLDVEGTGQEDIAARWGLDRPGVPFHYRTDRRGHRNPVDREAGDLYTLGDSFLVAGLTPSEATLPVLLERSLGRPVVNVALIARSLQGERDMLLDSGLPLDGRTVVHFVCEANDLQDSRAYRREGPFPRPVPAVDRLLLKNLELWGLGVTSPPGPAATASGSRAASKARRSASCGSAPTPRRRARPSERRSGHSAPRSRRPAGATPSPSSRPSSACSARCARGPRARCSAITPTVSARCGRSSATGRARPGSRSSTSPPPSGRSPREAGSRGSPTTPTGTPLARGPPATHSSTGSPWRRSGRSDGPLVSP